MSLVAKPELIWHPDFTEPKVFAVDANSLIVTPGGRFYHAVVEIPLPEPPSVTNGDLLIRPSYDLSFMPRLAQFFPVNCPAEEYVSKAPNRKIKPSVEAMLHLASLLFEVTSKTRRDPKLPRGRVETGSFSVTTEKDLLRRMLIAWQWPNFNAHRLTHKQRTEAINGLLTFFGKDIPASTETIKMEANRLELFIERPKNPKR